MPSTALGCSNTDPNSIMCPGCWPQLDPGSPLIYRQQGQPDLLMGVAAWVTEQCNRCAGRLWGVCLSYSYSCLALAKTATSSPPTPHLRPMLQRYRP